MRRFIMVLSPKELAKVCEYPYDTETAIVLRLDCRSNRMVLTRIRSRVCGSLTMFSRIVVAGAWQWHFPASGVAHVIPAVRRSIPPVMSELTKFGAIT